MNDLNQLVEVLPYDPAWPLLFLVEEQRLREALGNQIAGVEHIGSTAVPGLAAKPILDILLAVHIGEMEPVRANLAVLAYEDITPVLESAGVRGRIVFRRNDGRCIVHLVRPDSWEWHDFLRYRDYLRAYPREAELYAEAKKAALQSGAVTWIAYSEAKRHVKELLLKRSEFWRPDSTPRN
jgi:GrpB-like predicted nucleotidyltransferase (UPF0157 family)